ncbi:tetrahydromethanopterin S-methyltransferase subunit MtrC [Methanothrix sp.]|uniref:tetrahydromethanopterin S-methyltransferase subunit MtrC n=1 Tax=Methanothrix sp. TaxID=90426 RepID=UPI002CC82AFC|nr:tetrahydromethanopterin S-methyltransferase subunit C [Methanothrix sp.]HOK58620.1 tetrahydromethanopterin S-methyltransferase subunit C [Methanothrix sp.]HOL43747.1 tetrahydromethanopterin S-methyltransferase subunit C [Methanothrix sp.]HPO88832.1 tetrahydromethanopterin S-methyltransferase subunit C [Methanothrix sp.]
MTVGGGAGGAPSAIDAKKLRIYGIGGALVGIYLAAILNSVLGTDIFSILAAAGAVAAAVMGANAVRRVCGYGIGTGVPSIGMLALGMGIVGASFGLSTAEQLGVSMAGVIIALVYAMVFGYIVGAIANKVMGFNIPIMEEGLTDLSGAGAMAIIGWSYAISGSLAYADMVSKVFNTGYLAIVFICGGLAILHPFNANLGPDEKQDRTLVNGLMVGSLAVVAVGLCSLATLSTTAAIITIVIGAAAWYYFYVWYYRLVKRDAAAVVGTGLLPPSAL